MALQLANGWFRLRPGLVGRALSADCLKGARVLGACHLVQWDDMVVDDVCAKGVSAELARTLLLQCQRKLVGSRQVFTHPPPQEHVKHGVGKGAQRLPGVWHTEALCPLHRLLSIPRVGSNCDCTDAIVAHGLDIGELVWFVFGSRAQHLPWLVPLIVYLRKAITLHKQFCQAF